MRTAYGIACCLLLLAVGLDLSSKRCYATASVSRAECAKANQDRWDSIRASSHRAIVLGDNLALGGMIAAGSGIVCWIVSGVLQRKASKRITPVPSLVLLAAYAMLFLMAA
jgi:hypothetical protein